MEKSDLYIKNVFHSFSLKAVVDENGNCPLSKVQKNFICDHCYGAFRSGYHLKRHILIHTGMNITDLETLAGGVNIIHIYHVRFWWYVRMFCCFSSQEKSRLLVPCVTWDLFSVTTWSDTASLTLVRLLPLCICVLTLNSACYLQHCWFDK